MPVPAHVRVDRPVLAAYGRPRDLPDEELLGRLLAPNLERAGRTGGAPAIPPIRTRRSMRPIR